MIDSKTIKNRPNGYKGDIVFISKHYLEKNRRGRVGVLYITDEENMYVWDDEDVEFKPFFNDIDGSDTSADNNKNNISISFSSELEKDPMFPYVNVGIIIYLDVDASSDNLYVVDVKRIDDITPIPTVNSGQIFKNKYGIRYGDDINVFYNGVLIKKDNIEIIEDSRKIKIKNINNDKIWKNDVIIVENNYKG